MAEEVKKLTGRVQSVEVGKCAEGLNYEDLCTQPDVELPEGYKPPKFEMFNGTGDPKVHLRTYCDKLVRVDRDERICMKLFMRSLTGDALSWYISKNPKKWVNWLGERIEEGIKSGMVINFEALQATNKALQSRGISKKKEVGAVMVAQGPKSPLTYQTPPPTYQPSPPRYQQPATTYRTYNTQPTYYHSPPTRQNYQKPRSNFDRGPPKQYTPIAEPIDQLYERLKVASYITSIPVVDMENSSQWINQNKTCAYHSSMKGHTVDECRTLKDKIQTLINTKVIQAKEVAPKVRNNPLPDHKGGGVNVIETNEEWDSEGSIGLIQERDNPKTYPVTLTPTVVQTQAPIKVEVATPTPFEVEVITPFTVMVAPTSSYKSNVIPWDYVTKARSKGRAKIEETCAAQGMTRTGRVYTPEHLGGTSKEVASKSPVIETGPDDLWRNMQAREYSVVDHLNKTHAQISILSVLQNSETHRNALMKVLNEAYAPNNITTGEMANMVGAILGEEEEGLIIQTLEKGAILRNWTAAPSRVRQVPG
ncbi:uncharacterized protein [Nicotiana tomentosiformis]|uniref:uncharacterized protein n=1 Tax=Nicotiana tomentosiformis TaxID=4098 RepID=UPI00388C3F00